MPDAFSPAEAENALQAASPGSVFGQRSTGEYLYECRECHRPWPCDTARALKTVEELRDEYYQRHGAEA